MIRKYPALVHKDPDSDFGISFPDFPGCVTAGKSLEEAHALATEALQFHVDSMFKDGDTIPNPSIIEDVPGHNPQEYMMIPVQFPAEQAQDFMSQLIRQEVSPENIDDFIDVWHKSTTALCELWEFLGMTREEYQRWCIDPSSVEELAASQRSRGQQIQRSGICR